MTEELMCKCGHPVSAHWPDPPYCIPSHGDCQCDDSPLDSYRAAYQTVQGEKNNVAYLLKMSYHANDLLRAELATLRERVGEWQAHAARWQDYAIHLAHCGECASSALHCVKGQAFRDACFDASRPQETGESRG